MIYVYRTKLGTWLLRKGAAKRCRLCWYDRQLELKWSHEYPTREVAIDQVLNQTTGFDEWDSLLGVTDEIGMLIYWEKPKRFP